MSESHTLNGYLGDDFQQKCLWQLITEVEFAEKTIPLLKIDYFDDPTYKRFFSVITQFMETYGTPPNLQNRSILLAIRKFNRTTDVTEIEMLEAVAKQIKNWNDRVLNKELAHDGNTVQKETINFIKQQEYRKISSFIQNGVKEGNNTDEFLVEIEERVKKISEIGDDEDMGIEVMENIARALQREYRKPIPTGILGIDLVTKGGLGGGEIGVILAPTGVGKSTILSYIANTAYGHGHNVLQIIFEDKPDDIRRKHFAKWTGVPLSEMDDRRDETHEKVLEWHKNNKYGRLVIKKFSQEDTTMPKIRQYIEKYRKKHGIVFNIIVLDYIDVLESHKKSVDQNASELAIIKAFEGMAHDLDIPCWTAIQGNRGSMSVETVDTSQMGGNIKRAQKTHFLMSIAKTPEQKLIGQANIAILKARMAQDGHVFKDCRFNNNTMEISVSDDGLSEVARTSLNPNPLTTETVAKFNETMGGIKENEEAEEYIKPDDTIEDVVIENGEDILIKIHSNEEISNKQKNDISKMLDLDASKHDIMKK